VSLPLDLHPQLEAARVDLLHVLGKGQDSGGQACDGGKPANGEPHLSAHVVRPPELRPGPGTAPRAIPATADKAEAGFCDMRACSASLFFFCAQTFWLMVFLFLRIFLPACL